MGPKNKTPNTTDDNGDTPDHLALRLIELLNDDQVIAKLKQALFPKELSDKIEALNNRISQLTAQLDAKDSRIKSLEEKVLNQEISADSVEQYSRRANIHVCGIPEADGGGEDTDEKVLAVLNGKMGMQPPVQRHQIERSHRLGRKGDGNGPHRPRTVVVRFTSERLRDDVYRARTVLKTHNAEHRDRQIFLNEDLTARRGKLAYDTRQLKKEHKISDCWTTYGKVMMKDLAGRITEVRSPGDLAHF